MSVQVGIVMGSQSDWPTMRHAGTSLDALGVGYETRIVSAHRTPERLFDFAKSARDALHDKPHNGSGWCDPRDPKHLLYNQMDCHQGDKSAQYEA